MRKLQVLLSHILPILERSQYKGNSGKVAVVGGSLEYTGAPYYAAMASLRAGADLSYVVCPKEAVIPIKSYSPELIVYEWKDESNFFKRQLGMARSFIVGPGMGRHDSSQIVFNSILDAILAGNVSAALVLDADALWFVKMMSKTKCGRLGELTAVLTPNAIEFIRMWKAFLPDSELSPPRAEAEIEFLKTHKDTYGPVSLSEPIVKPVALLASEIFGNAVILRKGIVDIITDGKEAFFVSTPGSLKRPGGIGDLLAGTLGTFLQFKDGYRMPNVKTEPSVAAQNPILSTCVVASLVVRQAAKQAYDRKMHSMVCPDVLDELANVIYLGDFLKEQEGACDRKEDDNELGL